MAAGKTAGYRSYKGNAYADRSTGYHSGYGRENYVTRNGMYVYGNAAPKPEVAPRKVPTIQPGQERRTSRQVRRNRRRARSINPAYAAFLAVAAVLAVLMCVGFLRIQADIVSRAENVGALQKELAELTEQNDTALQAAEDSVNLEEVRNKAVNELGMVYAAQGRVTEYDSPTSDYVKQYNQIPENGILAKSGEPVE